MSVECLTYDLPTAAARTGVGFDTLRAKAKAGGWPGRRFATAWRFTEQDCLDILEICKVRPKQAASGVSQRTAARHRRRFAAERAT